MIHKLLLPCKKDTMCNKLIDTVTPYQELVFLEIWFREFLRFPQ